MRGMFSKFTERQRRHWDDAIQRLRDTGAEVRWEPSHHNWTIKFHDELRPGRGHYIDAIFIDGEILARIMMDVYGYPKTSWAHLDWQHADVFEECDCDCCVNEREDDETGDDDE